MDFREWILRISVNGSYGFPRMHPTKFVAKSVNFDVFSTFPFFESALMLPRTDQIKLVYISVRGSWSSSHLSFFRKRTVVVVGSLYRARSRLQPSIFRSFFPTYLESVPPSQKLEKSSKKHRLHLYSGVLLGASLVVGVCCGAGFLTPVLRFVERIPLFAIVSCLAIYSFVSALTSMQK